MPWDCTCGTHVDRDDDTGCPACGHQKGAWTLVADKTRTLSVTTRKAPFYCGDADDLVPLETGYAGMALVECKELVTIEKALVAQLAEAGLGPATRHVLVVRIAAGKSGQVTLVPEFEKREVQELAFATDDEPERPEGGKDVRFLLVHGRGDLPDAPPGVHLVDVGETTKRGYAPQLSVGALSKKRTPLPVVAERRAFVWSL